MVLGEAIVPLGCDMPDQKVDLFIKLCQQNKGRLSPKKKSAHFDFLTSDELVALEQVMKDTFP